MFKTRNFGTILDMMNYISVLRNKKVLLRERKRHTARRVAIAISCYSGRGGGGPLTKQNFPSMNMYQAKSGVKNFSLYWEGGVPQQKFFSSLNMYQAKSGVKIFSLYWAGGPSTKKIFPNLNMYQAKSGVRNFFLYWDRVPPLSPPLKCGQTENTRKSSYMNARGIPPAMWP